MLLEDVVKKMLQKGGKRSKGVRSKETDGET
jgi:hypothetical protein